MHERMKISVEHRTPSSKPHDSTPSTDPRNARAAVAIVAAHVDVFERRGATILSSKTATPSRRASPKDGGVSSAPASPRHDLSSAPAGDLAGRLGGSGTRRGSPSTKPLDRRGQRSNTGDDIVGVLGDIATGVGAVATAVGAATVATAATYFGGGLLAGKLVNATGIPGALVDALVKGGAGPFNPGAKSPGDLGGDAGTTPAAGTDDETTNAQPATTDVPDGGVQPDDGDVRPTPAFNSSPSERHLPSTPRVSRQDAASEPVDEGGAGNTDSPPPPEDSDTDPREHDRGRARGRDRSVHQRRAQHATPSHR